MNSRSIKFRLLAWYATLLSGILLLLCTSLYLDLRSFLENNARDAQARRARQLASLLLAHVKGTGESYVISQIRDWYAPESNDRFIRIAWLNLNNELQQLETTEELVRNASEAFELAQARYRNGISSIVELSEAQLNLTSPKISNAGARYNALIQQSNLEFQTGGLR